MTDKSEYSKGKYMLLGRKEEKARLPCFSINRKDYEERIELWKYVTDVSNPGD